MSIKTLIQRQQVNYIVRTFSAQERAFMGLPKNYIGINPGYWAKGDEVKNIFIEYDHFKPIAFFDITSAGMLPWAPITANNIAIRDMRKK